MWNAVIVEFTRSEFWAMSLEYFGMHCGTCVGMYVCGPICGYDGIYVGRWVGGEAESDVICMPARLAGP